ncbi:Diphthamide biosynthesis protein 2 [Mortierella sp. AD011]|nr:Diphthamide biosynthesis protein 2 [Mortierella sp. AD010]KAF9399925.1 Diphthamide biosynthesis protein 2 [Mortierella sp. AD011]
MSNSLSGPSNFADDGSAVITREFKVHQSRLATEAQEKIIACSDIYEIDRTVKVIKERGYKRIALQFPDDLLPDSGLVAQLIREQTGSSVYILADTSYGSCCVDEVAAQHISADAIIHYGRSCQSPTSRLPVIYVFGKQPVDVQECANVFDGFFGGDKAKKVVLMYDVIYSHCVDKLMETLEGEMHYTNIIKSRVETESNLGFVLSDQKPIQTSSNKCCQNQGSCFNGESKSCCSQNATGSSSSCQNRANVNGSCTSSSGCQTSTSTMATQQQSSLAEKQSVEDDSTTNDNHKRRRFGRTYDLPEGDSIEDYTLFYIGDESPTLSNIMMTHSKCEVYSYNPEKKEGRLESAQVNRALMRRYFLVQKAKDADIIGIAVGTLGVASYMTMIQHLKALIESKGKKAYTFVMGKLNVAKMANFMEIDCFVYVACPENSLIDSKEFYRPIVTPYELEIALSKSREWTGEYVTDFQQLLPDDDKIGVDKIKISQAQLDAASDREDEDESDQDSDEDQVPHFSLVTGQLKQNKRYTSNKEDSKELSALIEGTKDLTVRNKNTSVATLMSSAAGEYLQSREFRGLEVHLGETPVELATEGRAGIARGYNSEFGYEDREKEKY